ncbi:hypothetical protein AGMMS4957_11400 [Bacteroidia bacterium]|nr:hypothetical protein AGMMS4957_11400 [Bacteroidia bacterium]
MSSTFTALHNLIQGGGTSQIDLGDYIDLPALTISGTTITDAPINANNSRLLRLIVVGINSFKRDGGAVNNSTAPNHLVFQFQNVPVTHNMNSTATNERGYNKPSEMKTYIMNYFLPGLITATGLTDAMLWAPRREVANGGSGAGVTEYIADALWLPTECEMFGTTALGRGDKEPSTGQARLEYYTNETSNTSRTKYDRNATAVAYWLATAVYSDYSNFCFVGTDGSDTSGAANTANGCSPAFCVR